MREDQLQSICDKLRPILGKSAERLWIAYAAAQSMQDRVRAEAMILLYAARHLKTRPSEQQIYLLPPSGSECAGEFYLGDVYYGRDRIRSLYLDRENLRKHLCICGITGSGKTNVAKNLIRELLDSGIPVMILDWKRSFRQFASNRMSILAVGRRSPNVLKWNPLRPPPGVHPKTWIAIVAETLEKSHLSGLGSGSVFIDSLDRLFERRGFYAQHKDEEYPNFYDAREDLEGRKYAGRKMLWKDSCLRILESLTFGSAARSFNARDPVKLENLLRLPVVFEIDMEMAHPLRVSFCEILLRWIHLYRLGQGESEQLRHVLILEEAHNLFPRSHIEKQAASQSILTCCREIRSFGQSLILIDQHPSLIPLEILGNTNTQVFLPLSHHEDLYAASRSLFLDREEERYLDYLSVGEGIVKIKGRTRPTFVRFPLSRETEGEAESA